jgi:tetratricopeptide (TPR) repeat protein
VAGEGDNAAPAIDAPSGAPAPTAAEDVARTASNEAAARVVHVLIALLVLKRVVYHLSYLLADPFALVTFSDGQVYELAARDILAHPPLGAQPFYLQGLYSYLLALGMAPAAQPLMGLLLQLLVAGAALWLFYRCAVRELGVLSGGLSTCVLLAYPELAFYENKYLSVALGVSCNVFALWAACRALRAPRPGALVLAGFGAGLSVLGRPNLIVALPFSLAAVMLVARARRSPAARAAAAFAIGAALSLGPMALRNQIVIGRPDVFPSHGGAIPLYIGNNPHANGLWNDAGGLVTGQVAIERDQLAQRLGLRAATPAALDREVARALTARALRFVAEQPGAWLALEARKLWYTIGDHRFVRDYDVRGENELIGALHQAGLPFGVLLGLGFVGFAALRGRARDAASEERARQLGVGLVLGGQIVAVLAANLLVFTSAQNRAPLGVPLAFAAGPALLAIGARVRRAGALDGFAASGAALLCGALLFAQALWPRIGAASAPSSVHYFNLAVVEEELGRLQDAARHYARAVERNPRQPMFVLRQAHVLRRAGRFDAARAALDRLQAMPEVPRALRAAADHERRLLGAAPARPAPAASP